MHISTNRLIIRPLKETDIDDFFEIYQSEKTCQYLLHEPWTTGSKNEEFQKKLVSNQLTQNTSIHLACELRDKVIGDISICYTGMKDTVEIGYAFNDKFSGKGYAAEALRGVAEYLFYKVKVHRIQANLDDRNLSSAKLCERIGMRKEAHFFEDYWNKGEWTNSFVYGMLVKDL
jgi:RimJ/RimL family protein N-acetyltransferase